MTLYSDGIVKGWSTKYLTITPNASNLKFI